MPLLSISPDEDGPKAEYTNILVRGVARIFDLVYIYFISFAVGTAFFIVLFMIDNMTGSEWALTLQNAPSSNWDMVFGALAIYGYHVICEGFHGSTIGKLIFGMVVLGEDEESPCNFYQSLIRTIALIVDLLLFGAVAAFVMHRDVERKRVGDLWAGTVVVKRKSAPATSLRSGFRFVIVLTIASLFSALWIGLSLLFKIT